MSFLKKLFGIGRDGGDETPATANTRDYKGFTITAHPVAEGGTHRVSGTISRSVDGALREKRFDRADRLESRDTAVETTFQKGELMIDQQGDRVFD